MNGGRRLASHRQLPAPVASIAAHRDATSGFSARSLRQCFAISFGFE